MDKLVKEGVLSKTGKDAYTIKRQKVVLFHLPFIHISIHIILLLAHSPFASNKPKY